VLIAQPGQRRIHVEEALSERARQAGLRARSPLSRDGSPIRHSGRTTADTIALDEISSIRALSPEDARDSMEEGFHEESFSEVHAEIADLQSEVFRLMEKLDHLRFVEQGTSPDSQVPAQGMPTCQQPAAPSPESEALRAQVETLVHERDDLWSRLVDLAALTDNLTVAESELTSALKQEQDRSEELLKQVAELTRTESTHSVSGLEPTFSSVEQHGEARNGLATSGHARGRMRQILFDECQSTERLRDEVRTVTLERDSLKDANSALAAELETLRARKTSASHRDASLQVSSVGSDCSRCSVAHAKLVRSENEVDHLKQQLSRKCARVEQLEGELGQLLSTHEGALDTEHSAALAREAELRRQRDREREENEQLSKELKSVQVALESTLDKVAASSEVKDKLDRMHGRWAASEARSDDLHRAWQLEQDKAGDLAKQLRSMTAERNRMEAKAQRNAGAAEKNTVLHQRLCQLQAEQDSLRDRCQNERDLAERLRAQLSCDDSCVRKLVKSESLGERLERERDTAERLRMQRGDDDAGALAQQYGFLARRLGEARQQLPASARSSSSPPQRRVLDHL